jgi:hypothetical protein
MRSLFVSCWDDSSHFDSELMVKTLRMRNEDVDRISDGRQSVDRWTERLLERGCERKRPKKIQNAPNF